jgi:hypothetical protein
MTAIEHSVRTAHVRALRAAIEVAVKRACVTLDLPPGAQTEQLISEAAADVAQLYSRKANADMDLSLAAPQEKTT